MSATHTDQNEEELTDEERDLFERIAAKHEDDEKIRRICEIVLHSSDDSDDSSEVTKS